VFAYTCVSTVLVLVEQEVQRALNVADSWSLVVYTALFLCSPFSSGQHF